MVSGKLKRMGNSLLPFNAEFTEPLIAHVRFLGSPNSYIDCVIPIDESSFNPELLPTNKSE